MIKRILVVLTLALFSDPVIATKLPSGETEASLEARYLETADKLRCPTCVGVSVLESDAPFSVQLKDSVKRQVVEGKTSDQILEFFTDRYGAWVLREPPKKGFDLLAWLIPVSLMVLGPVLIWAMFWRRSIQYSGGRTAEEIEREFLELVNQQKEGGS